MDCKLVLEENFPCFCTVCLKYERIYFNSFIHIHALTLATRITTQTN
jgi:hypothetical protein